MRSATRCYTTPYAYRKWIPTYTMCVNLEHHSNDQIPLHQYETNCPIAFLFVHCESQQKKNWCDWIPFLRRMRWTIWSSSWSLCFVKIKWQWRVGGRWQLKLIQFDLKFQTFYCHKRNENRAKYQCSSSII